MANGTLNFNAGDQSDKLLFHQMTTSVYEGAETFNVNLSAAVNATISDNLGIGYSLMMAQGLVVPIMTSSILTISSPTVTEGGYATFTASLSNTSTTAVTFTPSLTSGSAIIGTDTSAASSLQYYNGTSWVSAAGGVSIPAGKQ